MTPPEGTARNVPHGASVSGCTHRRWQNFGVQIQIHTHCNLTAPRTIGDPVSGSKSQKQQATNVVFSGFALRHQPHSRCPRGRQNSQQCKVLSETTTNEPWVNSSTQSGRCAKDQIGSIFNDQESSVIAFVCKLYLLGGVHVKIFLSHAARMPLG